MRGIRSRVLLIWLLACASKVTMTTIPTGAFVLQGRERLGSAPVVVRTNVFGRGRVTVRLAGYRTVQVRLTPAIARAGTVEVRLVPEHGGAGTWSPEDVP
jgi:hypothetical protein